MAVKNKQGRPIVQYYLLEETEYEGQEVLEFVEKYPDEESAIKRINDDARDLGTYLLLEVTRVKHIETERKMKPVVDVKQGEWESVE